MSFLKTDITYLTSVGEQKAKLLSEELGINTFGDLLFHYPFRYVDRSKIINITQIVSDEDYVQFIAKVISVQEVGQSRKKRLVVTVEDSTSKIQLIWFKGLKWIKPQLQLGNEYLFYGKPTKYKSSFNLVHPEFQLKQSQINTPKFQAVYHSTEKLTNKGLNSKGIEKLVSLLLPKLKGKIHESLSQEIIQNNTLMSKEEALTKIHQPKDLNELQKARFTLKFEELFFIQLRLLIKKIIRKNKNKGFVFSQVGDSFNSFFHKHLPFELTNAQKKVVREIRHDMATGEQMNRLLQGDVGSGKTLVALLCILLAIDNGFQSTLMAPTEILATQHYHSLTEMLRGLPINVALLTGSTKASERKIIHADLANGDLHLLIGTHAIIEDVVQFDNLGLAIIDEQHKFGVSQRARLWKKNNTPPHMLVMTATPIPRTLAMTFYGDLDISVIDKLPPGRKPVKTIHYFEKSRLKLFGFIEQEVKKGRQIYIVYPLIEESEKLDYKNVMDGYESICRRFPIPEYKISIVHGQMKAEQKEFEMQKFVKGETQIMVATTVIEVGVNVPNASIMVIENAEKFGLAQLHQLRGRVGRGAEQSFCILMTDYKLSKDARIRIDTMTQSNDGFVIAETDLKLRGPGNIMGTQQSGLLNLKIADIIKDNHLLKIARNTAISVLKNDPNLSTRMNFNIRQELNRIEKDVIDWSGIS